MLVGRGGGSGSGTIWWGWLGDGEVIESLGTASLPDLVSYVNQHLVQADRNDRRVISTRCRHSSPELDSKVF